MIRQGNLLTLWDEAIPPEKIPKYPGFRLLTGKNGETTYYIARSTPVGPSRFYCEVESRAAEPGEPLRGPDLKFIPDWRENVEYRAKIKAAAENDPARQALLKDLCRSSILFYCNTFCFTFDPRRPPGRKHIPFVTFPMQDDVLTWMVWTAKMMQDGMVAKSRDMGATWCFIVLISWLVNFFNGNVAHLTSMYEDDVDNRTVDSLFGKFRYLQKHLPDWMRNGWTEHGDGDNKLMVHIPETGGYIHGQKVESTGGRGGRGTVLGADEFAHIQDGQSALEAFSELAASRFFISTPKGRGNTFARMWHEPIGNRKRLHWTQHPLKNPDWAKHEHSKAVYFDDATWNQEHEVSFDTSVEGRVFPQFIARGTPNVIWEHERDDSLVKYDPAYPVWAIADLGGTDPCSVLFVQIKTALPEFQKFTRVCLTVFGEYEGRDMTAYCLRYYLNSRGYRYRDVYVDMRTAEQKDSSGSSWLKNLADADKLAHYSRHFGKAVEVGPPVHVRGKRSWEEPTLDQVRVLMSTPGAFGVNVVTAPHLIQVIQNWSYPLDPDTRKPKPGASVNHDEWSHAGKALCYTVDNLHEKLKLSDIQRPHSDDDEHEAQDEAWRQAFSMKRARMR